MGKVNYCKVKPKQLFLSFLRKITISPAGKL